MTLFGCDISRWEVLRRDPLDLAAVKAAGISWVNIALSGSNDNVSGLWAQEYADRARTLGLGVCCYHWLSNASSGADQARWAYQRMREIGATAHQVDCEDNATEAVWRDYVDTFQQLLGRRIVAYTGDWWWTAVGRRWQGADLTPYLWAAPNSGYLRAYPGDDAGDWLAGYGGWPQLAVMQYTDTAMFGSVRCALSAVRDPLVWADLNGAPMRIPGIPYVQGRNAYTDQDSQKFGIAIHDTSNSATDEAETQYATVRTDGVSAHFYCDQDTIIQSLDTNSKAGHAGSSEGNENAIAVEITGQDGWTRAQWLANVAWDKLGAVCAILCQHYGIAVRRASVAEMQANPKVKAFYGHNDMRLAWGGTTHTDPGSNFPWDRLFAAVNAGGADMTPEEHDTLYWIGARVANLVDGKKVADWGPPGLLGQAVVPNQQLQQLLEKPAAAVTIDAATLAVALQDPAVVKALAGAVRAELDRTRFTT